MSGSNKNQTQIQDTPGPISTMESKQQSLLEPKLSRGSTKPLRAGAKSSRRELKTSRHRKRPSRVGAGTIWDAVRPALLQAGVRVDEDEPFTRVWQDIESRLVRAKSDYSMDDFLFVLERVTQAASRAFHCMKVGLSFQTQPFIEALLTDFVAGGDGAESQSQSLRRDLVSRLRLYEYSSEPLHFDTSDDCRRASMRHVVQFFLRGKKLNVAVLTFHVLFDAYGGLITSDCSINDNPVVPSQRAAPAVADDSATDGSVVDTQTVLERHLKHVWPRSLISGIGALPVGSFLQFVLREFPQCIPPAKRFWDDFDSLYASPSEADSRGSLDSDLCVSDY